MADYQMERLDVDDMTAGYLASSVTAQAILTSHRALKAANAACDAASQAKVTSYDLDTSCYDLKEPQDGEGTPGTPGGGASALALAASALTFIARSTGAPGFSVEHETTSEDEEEDEEEEEEADEDGDEDEEEEDEEDFAARLVDRQQRPVDRQLWPGAEAAGWSITHRCDTSRGHDGRRYTYTCPDGCAYSSRQAALRSLSGQEEGQEEIGREAVWSPELQAKLEAAVSTLREENVRPQPRRVWRLMNVEGLTLDSVTSHLHAHRSRKEDGAARSHGKTSGPAGAGGYYYSRPARDDERRPAPKAKPAVKRSAKFTKVKARAKGSAAPAWQEGDAVEAMDLRQVWCPATVQAVEGDELKVQHYEAWNSP